LLEIALAQNAQTHTSFVKDLEVSTPFPTILEDTPLELVTNRCASVLGVIVAPVPSFCCKKPHLPSTSVQGLPILGIKRQQERYRVALRVQCLTLYKAGILLDIICSR
jgi:hypothetical protein